MSKARKTTYQNIHEWGVDYVLTAEGLLFTASRLLHVHLHSYLPDSREGVSPHGIWDPDNDTYGNQLMLIISYADRAWRRIRNGSSRVRSKTVQGTRTAYDVNLSSTEHPGRAYRPGPTGNNIYIWTQYARLVVDTPIFHNTYGWVTPVVTFFPVE